MKFIPVLLLSLCCLCPVFSSTANFTQDSAFPSKSKSEGFLVRLGVKCDLVKDFPVDLTAATTGDKISATLGPKNDGSYCTFEALITRLENNAISVRCEFVDETWVTSGNGERSIRSVGFQGLCVTLKPGQEETLYSLGEHKLTLKYLP